MWPWKRSDMQGGDEIVKQHQQLTADRKNYFVVGPRCFDQEQIDRIKAIVDAKSEPAKIYLHGNISETHDVRRTQTCSLNPEAHTWLHDIVRWIFTEANKTMQYDIIPSMNDPIQLLRYDAEEQGFYEWHADTAPSDLTRKISVVVPLSDQQDYEGGKLMFNQGGALSEVNQELGRPLIFPSWLIHQVTPVTAGRRYSLVSWVRGPNWR